MNKISEVTPTTLAVGEQKTQSLTAPSSGSLETLSPDDADYAADVGEIIEEAVALAQQPPLETEEFLQRIDVWTRRLKNIIPREYLKPMFEAALAAHRSPFPVNAFELIAVWNENAENLERKKRAPTGNAILDCSGSQYHRPRGGKDTGEIIAQNPFSGKDERIPCPLCRPEDEKRWKDDQRARFGEIKSPHVAPAKQTVEKHFEPKPEVFLTAAEAKPVMDEFNRLVRELVPDEEAARMLVVIFDEGSNRFHHPGNWRKLYRREDLEKMIVDYQLKLDEREAKQIENI